MRLLSRLLLGALAAVCLAAGCFAPGAVEAQSAARARILTVGTGPFSGSYYPVGRAICRAVDRALAQERTRCSAETTAGSVYNLRMMQGGELDFAIAQADVQAGASAGDAAWTGAQMRDLRVMFTLFDELVVVVAAPRSAIGGIEDLRGRRVNIGSTGSGARATWEALDGVLAWQGADRIRPAEMRDGAAALCGGMLDAAVMVGFHPSAMVRQLLGACDTRLVPISGDARRALLARHGHYRPALMPAPVYGTDGDLETFAVASDFVTTTRADPRAVAAMVGAVLDNIDDVTLLAPALGWTGQRSIVPSRNVVPVHPAALSVFRERGLLP